MPFVIQTPGTPFTNGVGASLAPWNDPKGNWQALNAALAAMFEEAYGIVSTSGSPDAPGSYVAGYSTLLDPANCPASFLPYLSQFNGTGVQKGTSASDARSIITSEGGFQRGTPAAIIAAAKRNLTGTQSVSLLERTPNPYAFVVVVRPGEVTSVSALTAAVNAVKPAGLTWQLVQTNGWALYQMEATYGSNAALEAAFATDNGIETDQVGQ